MKSHVKSKQKRFVQINLGIGTQEFTGAEKSLFPKGPSFIFNLTDIKCLNLKCDFDKFVKPKVENQKVRIHC